MGHRERAVEKWKGERLLNCSPKSVSVCVPTGNREEFQLTPNSADPTSADSTHPSRTENTGEIISVLNMQRCFSLSFLLNSRV